MLSISSLVTAFPPFAYFQLGMLSPPICFYMYSISRRVVCLFLVLFEMLYSGFDVVKLLFYRVSLALEGIKLLFAGHPWLKVGCFAWRV